MERTRPTPPTTTEEGTAPVPSLPAVERPLVPVRECLAPLRAPGATAGEVDAFLAGLDAPYLAGESPRERADLMLDTLEDERLCELRGSDGRRVGLAALETLMRLGYPYVFDMTPEMLARARGTPPSRWPPRVLAAVGLTGVNVLLPVVLFGEDSFSYLRCEAINCWSFEPELATSISGPAEHLPLIVLLLLAPPVLGMMARHRTPEAIQVFLTAVQVVVGLVCLFMAFAGSPDFWRDGAEPALALIPGALSLLTAGCLFPGDERKP